MGKLTDAKHGDAANDLFGFYVEKASGLEDAGQYFMAAIASCFAIEASILAFILIKCEHTNGSELRCSDDVTFRDLIDAANDMDVLNAPINIFSHVNDDGERPKYIAKDVIDKLRKFRNLIHPAVALKRCFDPRTFTKEDLEEYKEIFHSIAHSLVHNI